MPRGERMTTKPAANRWRTITEPQIAWTAPADGHAQRTHKKGDRMTTNGQQQATRDPSDLVGCKVTYRGSVYRVARYRVEDRGGTYSLVELERTPPFLNWLVVPVADVVAIPAE